MHQIDIGGKVIGDGYPAYVIAEMAWAHDGSLDKAKKIVSGASYAGADAISMHITSLEDYMVRDYGRLAKATLSVGKRTEDVYDYLDRISIKNSGWKELFAYAKSLGLAVCAMPNDIPSLKLCSELNPDSYVIAAACFAEENLVSEIARQRKPLILRIGGATLGEIEKVVNLIRVQGVEDIVLLHGIQLYPTKIENTDIRLIPSLKAIFGFPVGLADHMDAESPLSRMVPLVALGFGANVIEKHITHDRALKGEDYISSLNGDEFQKLVEYIRELEKSFGSPSMKPLSEGELRYRQVSRKRTVAGRAITKGTKITKEDIAFKRADSGVYPDEVTTVIGRTAASDIKLDGPITSDKVF
ncbi:MAG: N-acetylneuraminate synthase family protein [Bdellovibrionota bacterium]|mgnify:CR=1 FL=1